MPVSIGVHHSVTSSNSAVQSIVSKAKLNVVIVVAIFTGSSVLKCAAVNDRSVATRLLLCLQCATYLEWCYFELYI